MREKLRTCLLHDITGVYPTEVPSNTQGWETVQEEESAVVPDVESNDYIFSDGCGLISDELTDLIVDILRKKGRIRSTLKASRYALEAAKESSFATLTGLSCLSLWPERGDA